MLYYFKENTTPLSNGKLLEAGRIHLQCFSCEHFYSVSLIYSELLISALINLI